MAETFLQEIEDNYSRTFHTLQLRKIIPSQIERLDEEHSETSLTSFLNRTQYDKACQC